MNDHGGAIVDLTKVIEILPNFAQAYIDRAISKHELKDYQGSISDSSKAIEIDPKNWDAIPKGISKAALEDFYGSVSDYNKALKWSN